VSKFVTGVGVVFVLAGLWVAFLPDQLVSVVDWESRLGLNIAAGVRVIIGLVLIGSASATRYPTGLRIFGSVVFLAGLILFFVPLDFWAAVMRWSMVDHLGVLRFGGGLVGVLLGAFLVHASRPRQPASLQGKPSNQ